MDSDSKGAGERAYLTGWRSGTLMVRARKMSVQEERTIDGALAGLAAALAYLAAQGLDIRLLRNRTDDLAIHGRLLARDPFWWRSAGMVMHCLFGTALGALYAAALGRPLRRRLPPWAAGVAFMQAENTALYPLLALMQRFHPAWREGILESYYQPLTAAQQVWRHLVFGAVLGIVLDRLERQQSG